MKKALIFVITILIPVSVSAVFDADFYYGMKNKPEIRTLQGFLRDQGLYSGPITGNFGSMTRDSVKKFQEREGIKPVSGYFGRLTRARANTLLGNQVAAPSTSETILAAIQALQSQLKELQAKLALEITSATTTAPVSPVTEATSTAPVTPSRSGKIIFSNDGNRQFPAVETSPYKIGEFTLHNDTESDVLFTSFDGILYDDIDSTHNRNNKIHLLIRDGTDVLDPLISKTEFTFLLTPPTQLGYPHRSILLLPFAVNLKTGEKKTFSMWIELLKYARAGTMKIYSTKVNATTDISIDGSLNLILTKEPDLW